VSGLEIWMVIVGITLATIATRATLLVAGQRLQLPHALVTALRYAPGCALAAIMVPDIVLVQGQVNLGPGNFRLVATGVAVAIFLLTRGTISTIVGGMLALWAMRWLAG
jgi:branched-subunit amino acid transport protein